MSSVREDAEKVWAAISKHDIPKLKDLLSAKTEEEVRNIVEYETNAIALTKRNNQRDGLTCLHYAAKKGHADMLKYFYRYAGETGINGDIRSSVLGWCPIHYAVYSGQIQAVKVLIREGVEINVSDNRGYSPLHTAIERGLQGMVALLVREQCDVNAQDRDGNTALHLCVQMANGWGPKEQTEVVDYLLTQGADYSISNNSGDFLLHTAVKHEAPKEPVETICKKMNEHEGIAVPNSQGKIPLHLSKSSEMTDILIEYGGNLNRQDSDGLTLIHERSDDVRIVENLIEKGADITIRDNSERLPIHHAVMKPLPDLEAIKTLGESLSDVNAQDEAGDTPLHLACDNVYNQIWIQVEKSGKTNRVLKSVDSKSDPVVSWLVFKGADCNIQNSKGETPLHRALKHKATSKADILARAGADPLLVDSAGVAALKLNSRWFNKMDKQGTFLSSSRGSLNSSRGSLTERPRESWLRRLSKGATALFTPRIHLEEETEKPSEKSPSPDWTIDSSSQDSAFLIPPKARLGTPSASAVIAAPPAAIRFTDADRAKTQLGAFRMKREQTLLRQNGPMKATDTKTKTETKTKTKTETKTKTKKEDATPNPIVPPEQSEPESLSLQLSSLHDEVSDVKELLEELSNEGDSLGTAKQDEVMKASQPELLERQLTSLHDEVTEVKQMLEQLHSDSTNTS